MPAKFHGPNVSAWKKGERENESFFKIELSMRKALNFNGISSFAFHHLHFPQMQNEAAHSRKWTTYKNDS